MRGEWRERHLVAESPVLDAVRLFVPVLPAEVGVVRVLGAVAVLDPGQCLIQRPGAEVEGKVGLDSLLSAFAQNTEPVHKLVGPCFSLACSRKVPSAVLWREKAYQTRSSRFLARRVLDETACSPWDRLHLASGKWLRSSRLGTGSRGCRARGERPGRRCGNRVHPPEGFRGRRSHRRCSGPCVWRWVSTSIRCLGDVK